MQCYLEFNPDAFRGEILTEANGTNQVNLYWTGNQAIDYSQLRGPGRNNLDISLSRDFRIKEKYTVSFHANVTNALNHTQFLPGSFNMELGSMQTTAVPSEGLLPGFGQSAATYGSHRMLTFDPRQMILEMRFRF